MHLALLAEHVTHKLGSQWIERLAGVIVDRQIQWARQGVGPVIGILCFGRYKFTTFFDGQLEWLDVGRAIADATVADAR